MKFHLTVISLLCFALPALSSEAAAQQNTLKQQLVGTWTVVSFTNENERTGKKTEVYGSDPKESSSSMKQATSPSISYVQGGQSLATAIFLVVRKPRRPWRG